MLPCQIKQNMPRLPGVSDRLDLIRLPAKWQWPAAHYDTRLAHVHLYAEGKARDLHVTIGQFLPLGFLLREPLYLRAHLIRDVNPAAAPGRRQGGDSSNQQVITHGTSLLARVIAATAVTAKSLRKSVTGADCQNRGGALIQDHNRYRRIT